MDRTRPASSQAPDRPQAASFVRQSPNFSRDGLLANTVAVEPKAVSQTFLPRAPVFIDESIFLNPRGDRKLPVALHLWLHQHCPPGMSIIITVSEALIAGRVTSLTKDSGLGTATFMSN